MSGANSRKGQSPFYGSDTIALVDLNYTLVGNSPKWGEPRITPFSRQIEQETYRQWVVDFLRDKIRNPHYGASYSIQRTNACEDFLPDKLATAGSVFCRNFRHSSRNQGRLVVALYIPETRQEWKGLFWDRKQSKDKRHVFVL